MHAGILSLEKDALYYVDRSFSSKYSHMDDYLPSYICRLLEFSPFSHFLPHGNLKKKKKEGKCGNIQYINNSF